MTMTPTPLVATMPTACKDTHHLPRRAARVLLSRRSAELGARRV